MVSMNMKRNACIAFMAGLLVMQSACGYFMGGTWENDPKNWERAFNSKKPTDVVILHSRYWRSTHWSYEYEYYFELGDAPVLRDQLFAKNQLRRLSGDDAVAVKVNLPDDAPPWFMPKGAADYEVSVHATDAWSHFTVMIDKSSGNVYLYDRQL